MTSAGSAFRSTVLPVAGVMLSCSCIRSNTVERPARPDDVRVTHFVHTRCAADGGSSGPPGPVRASSGLLAGPRRRRAGRRAKSFRHRCRAAPAEPEHGRCPVAGRPQPGRHALFAYSRPGLGTLRLVVRRTALAVLQRPLRFVFGSINGNRFDREDRPGAPHAGLRASSALHAGRVCLLRSVSVLADSAVR